MFFPYAQLLFHYKKIIICYNKEQYYCNAKKNCKYLDKFSIFFVDFLTFFGNYVIDSTVNTNILCFKKGRHDRKRKSAQGYSER